jgi:hypothetical protein
VLVSLYSLIYFATDCVTELALAAAGASTGVGAAGSAALELVADPTDVAGAVGTVVAVAGLVAAGLGPTLIGGITCGFLIDSATRFVRFFLF